MESWWTFVPVHERKMKWIAYIVQFVVTHPALRLLFALQDLVAVTPDGPDPTPRNMQSRLQYWCQAMRFLGWSVSFLLPSPVPCTELPNALVLPHLFAKPLDPKTKNFLPLEQYGQR